MFKSSIKEQVVKASLKRTLQLQNNIQIQWQTAPSHNSYVI